MAATSTGFFITHSQIDTVPGYTYRINRNGYGLHCVVEGADNLKFHPLGVVVRHNNFIPWSAISSVEAYENKAEKSNSKEAKGV